MNYLWKKIKQSIFENKGFFTIGIGDIFGNIISAGFWFILAALMSPNDYGNLHYLLAIAGMGQIFSLISPSNTLIVYSGKKIPIQSTLILFSILLGFVSAIIITFQSNRIDVIILMFGFMFIEITSGILLGEKKYFAYSKYLLLQKICLFVLGLSFFHIFGLDGIILGISLSYFVFIKIIISEIKKYKINLSLLNDKKGFIVNNYLLILSGSMGSQIDKFIIFPILGNKILGEYSLSLQMLIILTLISGISFKYFLSQDSRNENNAFSKKIIILLSVGIAIFGSLILPLIIPIFFSSYTNSIDAIRILSWTVVPETIQLILSSKLLGLERSKYVLISNITSTVFLILGFVLLGPIYGIIGLSIVLLISTIIQVLILIYGLKKLSINF